MTEKSAGQLLVEYGDEPAAGSLRTVAPQAFDAIEAVIDLHREPAEKDRLRGHWTGSWENGGRWVRDEPAWCPICDVALPCPTVQVIADKLS